MKRVATSRARFALLVVFPAYALLALGYSVAIGPLRAPDERNHFLRAYQISEGRFTNAYRVSDEEVGDDLPSSLARLSVALGDHQVHKIDAAQLSAARSLRLEAERREFIEFSTAPYAPLAYLPAALAIAAGRVADAAPLTLLYMARWANVATASALIVLAMGIAGYAARGLSVLALFPMTLAQVAVVSADALSFAIAFLWIAVVMNAATRSDRLSSGCIATLVGLALALSQLRPPFPLLGLLALAIPLRSLGNKPRALVTVAAVVAASLLPAAAWSGYAMHLQAKPAVREHVAPTEQLRHVVDNPGAFLRVLARDLRARGYEYWHQAVGRLGWLNVRLPEWIPAGFLAVFLAALCATSRSTPQPLPWQRWFLATAAVGGAIGVLLTLYLTFNGVGSRDVRGVQGRYFIPVLAVMAFAASNHLLDRTRWRIPLATACIAFIAAAHAGAFLTLAHAAAGE